MYLNKTVVSLFIIYSILLIKHVSVDVAANCESLIEIVKCGVSPYAQSST